ncbi:MAG: SDR family oxidoreductase [Desulfobaccales bacterium]
MGKGGKPKRILVLGASGALGHVMFTWLSGRDGLEVFGTVRDQEQAGHWFSQNLLNKCLGNVDAFNFNSLINALALVKPEIVVNCIGIVKQSHLAADPVMSISINSLLPHRLAVACRLAGIRLIQMSTDCVFDGVRGNYREEDPANALDIYGRTKALGEVTSAGCLTVRTSIISHELRGKLGLLEWFLAQKNQVRGFTRAIFSGFPMITFTKIIEDYLLEDPGLTGLYHISSVPITKYDLLKLVAKQYGKKIEITPDHSLKVDRSLDSSSFRKITGYTPPSWPEMVAEMHQHYLSSSDYK